MGFEDLTPEQMEQAKACKTEEELAELAEQTGIELSDGELDAISGGASCRKNTDCHLVC